MILAYEQPAYDGLIDGILDLYEDFRPNEATKLAVFALLTGQILARANNPQLLLDFIGDVRLSVLDWREPC